MNHTISFDGTKTISKGRSGRIITSGIAVSVSTDGKLLVVQPVNSHGVISPASCIEMPVEKAEAVAQALLATAQASVADERSVAASSVEVAVEG